MTIKAIIVDDEPPAVRELRRLLAEHVDVDVVGDAASVDVARGLALRTGPDVVFLDINLGGASGFELVPSLDLDTAVVFVTAYDAHAVEAFAANALDYLVKPVAPARLAESVARVRRWSADRRGGAAAGAHLFSSRRWLMIVDGEHPELLELAAVAAVFAEAEGSRLVGVDGRARKSPRTLAQWEERLPEEEFVRVSRSAIVNLRQVVRVEGWSNYAFRVEVRGVGEAVVVSRRRATALRDRLR